ncbi:MAG: hypothetical protein M1819_000644 [Sarea resinae]|nr:MAG: hypothetical protein M1819_000644 [Sarea resinae]
MTRLVTPLNEGWTFKQADDAASKFLPVAQFPTNVHLDLLANGLIPDPYYSQNENDVQWVGEKAWLYRTTFDSPLSKKKVVLAFDGLDTYATVHLNGNTILQSDNMFIPHRIDVSDLLINNAENELRIRFESAWMEGKKIALRPSEHEWICWNGDPSRMAVRKAQYHYGWDWGPTLLTCGPWRPINLEVYTARITDLSFKLDVPFHLQSAEIVARAEVEGPASEVLLEIHLGEKLVASETVPVLDMSASVTFITRQPRLWYPAGYGEQPLYTLTATLFEGSSKKDQSRKRLGIRRAKVVQHKLKDSLEPATQELKDVPGTSFYFEINNVPIFCGGSNWIPTDSFIPRITKERYRDWVQLMVDGNQVMTRVWAGGIYEEAAFYDACDELGVLVWQDFLFACGNYPTFPAMLDSVRKEATANVKQLRHHPSIVLWAGNNEDYQIQETSNLDYDPEDKDPESWLRSSFPARYIYEKLLADVMKEVAPDSFYHYGSPWGGKSTRDPTVGDIHQWNVWHESQEKYQDFDKLSGRFVTEFGMQGFPNMKTIDGFIPPDSAERYPQSSIVDFHNKAAGHERRLAVYLVENIRFPFEPFEQHVYCTQLVQAECVASAFRLWRRQWKGPGHEYCAGALVWQMNDCWPCTSWSIVDYYLRPKLAYYAIKREMAPLTIGMKRSVEKTGTDPNTLTSVSALSDTAFALWASNLSLGRRTIDIQIKAWNIISGKEVFSAIIGQQLILEPNRSAELGYWRIPMEVGVDEAGQTVVGAYIFENGKQVARSLSWPEPLKYVHLQKPRSLRITLSPDRATVSLSAEVPLKGVALEIEDDGIFFDDNGVDLVPGEVVTIGVKGAEDVDGIKFGVRYLGL